MLLYPARVRVAACLQIVIILMGDAPLLPEDN